MSAFLPRLARPEGSPDSHPVLLQRPSSPAEQKARWEVRAAQWRAREIAEAVFGRVAAAELTGMRAGGSLRGLLRLDVTIRCLDRHRDLEGIFMAAVASDPILAQVPLVYVFGHADG